MSNNIKVTFRDKNTFISNNVIEVGYFGGQLIILMYGICGGIDTKNIDETNILKVEFDINGN